MKKKIYKANDRGQTQLSWLDGRHYFSFGDYYDPKNMGFGSLRVINDDRVAPHSGFETHPHANMEIITVPLRGTLTHNDSTDHRGDIRAGDVQVMTAGEGILHSEHNLTAEEIELFQIWIQPREKNLTPRYDQKTFRDKRQPNVFQLLISPDGRLDSLKIEQNAYISWIDLEQGDFALYEKWEEANGIFVLNVSGKLELEGGVLLYPRDAIALEEFQERLDIKAREASSLLVIEIPL